jgi:hypothetical protein
LIPLGAESLHLARDFLYGLQECGDFGRSAKISALGEGSGFYDAVRTAANPISGWPTRTVCTVFGSWLHQMLRRKYSGRSGARLLRCLRN